MLHPPARYFSEIQSVTGSHTASCHRHRQTESCTACSYKSVLGKTLCPTTRSKVNGVITRLSCASNAGGLNRTYWTHLARAECRQYTRSCDVLRSRTVAVPFIRRKMNYELPVNFIEYQI